MTLPQRLCGPAREAVTFLFLIFSLLFLVSTGSAQTRDNGENEGETGEEIIERFRYLHEKRAGGPGRDIPQDAYATAVQERIRFEQSESRQSPLAFQPWVSVNPTGMFYAVTGANYISGRTNSMAFHPTDPNTFYCAAAGGGVWKTTNGGSTWVTVSDNLTSLMSGAIAIDPLFPSTLYYGTGELNYSLDSYYGDGVYKTTNAGVSWTKIVGTTVGSYISQIVVDPTNSNVVYLSGNSGVFKSTNGGANWTSTSSGSPANCVFVDPTNTQIVYTTTGTGYSSGNLVKKSTNGGASWTTLAGGLPTSNVGRIQLAMAQTNSSTLYASISNSSTSGLLGLYRTTDGGTTWTAQATTPNYLSSQGWYDNTVCVKPTDANTVIVGGLDIYKSTTGGGGLVQMTSWSTSSSTNMSHADIHFLGYNGSVLYCGSDGGVYKSTNDGSTWTDLNATISSLQFQSADYDPTNPLKMYGGCQDNNKQATTNGGATWTQRTTGDGGCTIVDPLSPNYVYGQYVNGSCQRSTNSGVSFSEIRPTGSSGGLFYNPFEMAPGDPNTIVYGVAQVWKTTTARTATSSGWTQIASSTSVGGGSVSAIGISWTNTNKIYVGTNNGRILVTTDNGTNWTTTTGYPYVSDLVVDPSNDDVCYATFTGFTSSTHVYKTTNAGVSWFSVTSNLPNIPTNTIVVVPQTPRWLFVGTDLGVYQSTNDGASWNSFNTGIPTVTIYDLKYKNGPKLLMAATHGRGCFTNDLTSALVGSISVTSPVGGEVWGIGSAQTITWTSTGVSGNVNIELSTNGGASFPTTLFTNTANDGTEVWTVSGPASTTARIRITSVSDGTIRDSSHANFAVVQPTVTVSSPNGGESWAIGSTQAITWSSTNLSGNVKIELSTDGGTTYPTTLFANTANDGTEQWLVSGPVSSSARLRITSVSLPSVADVSDGNFSMVQPTLAVTSPAGGESWLVGTSHSITWTSTNLPGNVKIELSTDGGATYPITLSANTANDGTETWTVTGPATTAAKVRVTSLAIPTLSGTSASNFTMVQPAIAVTAPAGGETWEIGTAQTIAWTSMGVTGNVKIEVSRDGGGSYTTLNASTPNDGTEQWMVSGPPTTNARVRVSNVDVPSLQGVSANPFTVSASFALFTKLWLHDGGGVSDSLEWGTAAGATDGIDPDFGEYEQPPPPPIGVLDVRWSIAGTQGSKRDIRDTLGGSHQQIISTGKLQPSEAGYPFVIRWRRNELPPTGSFTLRDGPSGFFFNVNMRQQDSVVITDEAVVQFQLVYGLGTTVGSTVQGGWNVVSLPVTVADRRKTVVYPTSTSSAYTFTPGGYAAKDTLNYGVGYWLRFPSTQTVSLTGGTRTTDTINVVQGWNMIGSISGPVPVGSIVQIPGGIVASSYYGYNGVYVVATTIDPARGYWVKVNQNGKLVLSGGAVMRFQPDGMQINK